MKRSTESQILLVIAICAGAALFHSARLDAAEDVPSARTSEFRLYGGAAIGYGNASGENYSEAADGPQYLLDADLSYLCSHWVSDLGVGWLYSKLQGSIPGSRAVDLRTRAGFIDASVRYRLAEHWQVGPAFNLLFGTDTSFTPSVRESGAGSLLGLRAVYETQVSEFPFRIVGQGLTLLGGGGTNYTLASLGFQIGLPLFHSSSDQSDRVASSSSAPLRREPTEALRVTLSPERVFFQTDSSRIRPEVRKVLRELGAYLAKNGASWQGLRLSGHADQRGADDYNMRLSQRRAQAVYRELLAGGLDRSKVSTEHFGFHQPVDPANNRVAWAKNRRVELVFADVQNPDALKHKLEQLTVYSFDPNH